MIIFCTKLLDMEKHQLGDQGCSINIWPAIFWRILNASLMRMGKYIDEALIPHVWLNRETIIDGDKIVMADVTAKVE